MECNDLLTQEYFKIVDIISEFDDRLLIIKSWAVTFSLVMLATALQKRVAALFWVSSLSALCFFLLDGAYKNYQTNYYPQMRNIEIICSGRKAFANTGIDWGWSEADEGRIVTDLTKPKQRPPGDYFDSLFNLGVMLPYLLPFLFGILLGSLSLFNTRFREFMANKTN